MFKPHTVKSVHSENWVSVKVILGNINYHITNVLISPLLDSTLYNASYFTVNKSHYLYPWHTFPKTNTKVTLCGNGFKAP